MGEPHDGAGDVGGGAMEERKANSGVGTGAVGASTLSAGGLPSTPRSVQAVIKTRPKAKARPRMSRQGHVYTPKETKEYEKLIATEWVRQTGTTFEAGTLEVWMEFRFKRPKTHYHTSGPNKGLIKVDAPYWYTSTPDLDNVEKAILDALNGIAYVDDKYIASKNSIKVYDEEDSVIIRVRRL